MRSLSVNHESLASEYIPGETFPCWRGGLVSRSKLRVVKQWIQSTTEYSSVLPHPSERWLAIGFDG